eukprot:evm.model.scf_1121.2 EVM.evm.TU.scf_1121.2   scf_1121:49347-51538(+)
MAASAVRDDPLGLQAALKAQLQAQGDISLEDFETRYPAPGSAGAYLDKVTFDVRRAKYWDLVTEDIHKHNKRAQTAVWGGTRTAAASWRRVNAKLSDEGLRHLKSDGFVVGGSRFRSFGDAFHNIYSDDLPVWVGADPMLHAWHKTYEEMLIDLEAHCLAPRLRGVLEGMRSALEAQAADLDSTALGQGMRDADWFLTVALSLLKGKEPKEVPAQAVAGRHRQIRRWGQVCTAEELAEDFGREASALGCDAAVEATLARIEKGGLACCEMFGGARDFDFSQLKPRGHYERSATLRRYFRAVMWCGRVDMRMGGEGGGGTRELGCALAMLRLLKESGQFREWEAFHDLLDDFVGDSDSMTFRQLDALLGQYCSQTGVQNVRELKRPHCLDELLALIRSSKLGEQAICSSVLESDDHSTVPVALPLAFTFMGQKFTIDSWAISNTVFDRVFYKGQKVLRAHPSCLDVCFSVFGNNSVMPHIVNKVKDSNLPYHSGLAAVREVVDALPTKAWNKNLYMLWLRVLRALSEPTVGEDFPEAMRTQAWAAKSAETQIASWSQLRHDNILYAKPSYGMICGCEYPAGYVEPRPEFWSAFQDMVKCTREITQRGWSLGAIE